MGLLNTADGPPIAGPSKVLLHCGEATVNTVGHLCPALNSRHDAHAVLQTGQPKTAGCMVCARLVSMWSSGLT